MRALLPPPARGLILALHLLAMPAPADETAGPDYFDIIGSSPAEVVASITRAMPTDETALLVPGFVGLPMSGERRKEFIARLQATLQASPETKYFAVLCLVDLLEEEGRFNEAIERVRSDLPPSDDSHIREAGLLWKAGKAADATELALRVSDSPANERAWLSLVKIDLIQGRPDDAMRLLGFFHQLAGLAPRVRHLLAIQHLEITRRDGRADALVAASPTPALRAVWNMALGRKAQAIEAVEDAPAGLSAGDIGLLALALPGEPLVAERAKAILAQADLPLAQRRSLLGAFGDSRQRFTLWSAMSGGHGATADLLEPLPTPRSPDERVSDHRTCLRLMTANPGEVGLKWLVAKLDPGGPEQAKPLLLEVARAFRESPGEQPTFADPAAGALKILVKICTAQELKTLVVGAPGFADLPAPVRLRYLMAADLDQEVIATIKDLSFRDPSGALLGGQLRVYFERRAAGHVIPAEVFALLMDRLPEMVAGASPRSKYFLQDQTGSWLKFFGTHSPAADPLVDAIRRLVAAAGALGPELRDAVIAGIPDFAWTLPGLALERPAPKTTPPAATQPSPHLALSIFTPPDPAVIGQGARMLQIHRYPSTLPRHRDPFAISLLATSPWEQNLRGIDDRGRFDPAVQAKLRMLFDKSPSRTLIYDLLVATGVVECPDPVVKASAEQRIAGLDPKQQEDPAIALYLFFHRLAKGTPMEECLPLLDGQKDYTRPALERASMRAFAQADRRYPSIRGLVQERMGLKIPAPPKEPAEPPQPPSVYDRMQFFQEAGTEDSPEAIALAREVLFDFIESQRAKPSPDENVAVAILAATKRFDTFIDDLKEKLEAAGRSELEVQRALYRVHLYRIVHSKGECEPFARRIFELDPGNTEVVHDVLHAAIRTADHALTLKCLQALGRQSREMLLPALNNSQPPNALGLFTGPRARELAEVLMQIPLAPHPSTTYRSGDERTFLPLYLHISRHAPDQLKPLLRWAGELTPARARELLSIALVLRETLSEEEVRDLLAMVLFTPPPEEAPDAVRFAPRAIGILPAPESFDLSGYARSGWAKRLSDVAAGYPPSDATAGTKILLHLAAAPTPETWQRLVPDFIATLPVAVRDEIRRQLETQVQLLPASAALENFLAKGNMTAQDARPTLYSILQRLDLATKAGDRSGIPTLWEAAKKLLPAETESQRLDFVSRASHGMFLLAEAAVWNEFLEIAGKTEGFAGQWIRRHSNVLELSSSPVRAADLARVIVPQLEPGPEHSWTIFTLFDILAAVEAPDTDLLRTFVPWIDESTRRQEHAPATSARRQWLDLLLSDLAAVCPQISATPRPDSKWSVDWSLAGFKGFRSGYPSARQFPYLDGQFDLDILAGPAPERLARVAIVAKAAATGRLTLELAQDTKFISLLARQSDGGIVRWSHPVAIPAASRDVAVNLRPATVDRTGSVFPSTVLPAGGPFRTEDAMQFELPPGAQIELARLPWTVGDVPEVSGWIQKSGNAGSISLSFRADEEIEIRSETLESGDAEVQSIPLWQRFKTPSTLDVPAETVSVALVYRAGHSTLPSKFRVSEVRMVPPKVAATADGFTLLGRIPGQVWPVTFDRGANRFATSSVKHGVGVFDFVTREFSGWIPLGDPSRGRGANIAWMALAGDRLVCVEQNGEVYLVSVAKRSAKLIRKLKTMTFERPISYPVRLSPDGQFLAWSGIMAGVRIAKLGENGIEAERLLETGQIQWLDFKPSNDSLVAIGTDRTFSLNIADWQTAAVAVRPTGEEEFTALQEAIHPLEGGQKWTDPLHQVTFGIRSENADPSQMDPVSRYVTLPDGFVAADIEGNPFFISSFGQVFRIDPSKLKGYQPPEKK